MSETKHGTVYVVDDDEATQTAIRRLVEQVDLPVESYSNAEDFLTSFDPDQGGCIVLDVRMPGMSGIQLQKRLRTDARELPIVFISGHGDVPLAVS